MNEVYQVLLLLLLLLLRLVCTCTSTALKFWAHGRRHLLPWYRYLVIHYRVFTYFSFDLQRTHGTRVYLQGEVQVLGRTNTAVGAHTTQ